ncbi:PerC family transcriptional regulator [Kluyvera sp. CHPC 1.251]|uniref:PerC family transcriptional regulator n=1 Tax=Kluyvera sp. CHPC 1.251 TaxID=2995175 RepID=UPI002FD837E8
MTAEVNALIMLAQCNESKGFYRRALRIWQEISTHFDATKEQCRLAWDKISACHLQLQINTPVTVSRDSRKQDVERDKVKIQQLLAQGHSIKEIQHLTGRSIAFIYKYNPRNKTIH